MFWKHAHIQQIATMVTSSGHSKAVWTHMPRGSGDRFGSCPHCQAFVRIGPIEADLVSCPNCRRPVGELDPLWTD